MSAKTVSDDVLNKMIAQQYTWETLPPEVIYGMAVEISKSRYVIDRQYKFIGELLATNHVEAELESRRA